MTGAIIPELEDNDYVFVDINLSQASTNQYKNIVNNYANILRIESGNVTISGDPSVLDFVENSNLFPGNLDEMAIDDSFIYVGTNNNLTAAFKSIHKIDKNNLTTVGNTGNFTTAVQRIASDDSSIWALGFNRMIGYYKNNLSSIPNSTFTNIGVPQGVALDNDFVYVSTSSEIGIYPRENSGTKQSITRRLPTDESWMPNRPFAGIVLDNDTIYAMSYNSDFNTSQTTIDAF
jgi:hypothetical protein